MMAGFHSGSRRHWDLPGRAALPRRPNFSRNERSDVPAPMRDDDHFVPRWTRATEKRDARQRIPAGEEGRRFMAILVAGAMLVSVAAGAQGWQPGTNFTLKSDFTLRETYDNNVFLQDAVPSPTIPNAVQPRQGSFVTSLTPNLALDYTVLYIDGTATLRFTGRDTVTVGVRQYTQTAFASCSVYEDTTYSITGRHRFDQRWSAGCGFRAYAGDWLAPVNREDWIYTPSAGVVYSVNRHLTCEATYSCDWTESKVPDTDGRNYTRHLVSVTARYAF